MARQRARLKDNDPLSPTDEVLAGLEQFSKLTSQQAEKSTVQEANKLTSQQAESSGSQNNEALNQKRSGERSKQVVESTDKKQANKSTSQESDKLTSQPVNKPTIRKATFQLSDAVLQQLDTFHLQLQLEMGKANAPYKEVMVEEAIAQLLEQAKLDRAKLIKALQQRQQQRE